MTWSPRLSIALAIALALAATLAACSRGSDPTESSPTPASVLALALVPGDPAEAALPGYTLFLRSSACACAGPELRVSVNGAAAALPCGATTQVPLPSGATTFDLSVDAPGVQPATLRLTAKQGVTPRFVVAVSCRS